MTDDALIKLWDETNYFIDIAGLSRKLLLFYVSGHTIKTALKLKDRTALERRLQKFHDGILSMINEGRLPWQAEEHKDDLVGWLFEQFNK